MATRQQSRADRNACPAFQFLVVLAGVCASLGASYRTTNFLVEAPTPQIAQQVGQTAEFYRKDKAIQWLGQEMPPWVAPCPLTVKITIGGAGGATSFNFMNGQVWQRMDIEGPLDRVLASVLPHEITHTVFAHYFRMPVPRWADEGGAVLSEDELERGRHDQMVRQILAAGRAFPLNRLFNLRDYPREVGNLYAEGYSVVNFLVASSSRKVFLDFVAHGMQYGWDSAAQVHYRYQTVNELESAWIKYLRETRRQPAALVARNTSSTPAEPVSRVIVRLTAPPVEPMREPPVPIIRGQAPDVEQPRQPTRSRPGYLPGYMTPSSSVPANAGASPISVPQDRWQPGGPTDPAQPPNVRLGYPQFGPQPFVVPARDRGPISPVGYPD
jgi:hypothetical protein